MRIEPTSGTLRGLQQLERHRQSRGARAGPLVTRVRSFTVAKVDSIGLVLPRCFQCAAGKSK